MMVLGDMTEKQWQAQVLETAGLLGYQHYHTYRSVRSPAGFPDLVLAGPRVVFVELKTERGKVSAGQAVWLTRLFEAGAEVYVARPRHLQELTSVLAAPADYDVWSGSQLSARAVLLEELDGGASV